MEPQIDVRPLSSDDLGFAADLHLQRLPHGFFTRLGPRFMRTYYRSFIDSPHAVALIAVRASHRTGVIVGTVNNRNHYSWTLRNMGWELGLVGLLALLARPRVLALFARTRLRRYARAGLRMLRSHRPGATRSAPATAASSTAGSTEPSGATPADGSSGGATTPSPEVAVLTHVAVDPSASGSGTGRRLTDSFRRAVASAGASEIRLVTLAGDEGASGFYRRLGWHHVADRSGGDGSSVSEYRMPLETAEPSVETDEPSVLGGQTTG